MTKFGLFEKFYLSTMGQTPLADCRYHNTDKALDISYRLIVNGMKCNKDIKNLLTIYLFLLSRTSGWGPKFASHLVAMELYSLEEIEAYLNAI